MNELAEALQSLYNRKGSLTPTIVVDEARPKSSPLHSHFEWDNSVAGEKYRQEQARRLIRSVRISYTKEPGKSEHQDQLRYYVSVKKEDGCSYHPVSKVAKDEYLTELVLREMEREWRNMWERYGHFKEFAELIRKSIEVVDG